VPAACLRVRLSMISRSAILTIALCDCSFCPFPADDDTGVATVPLRFDTQVLARIDVEGQPADPYLGVGARHVRAVDDSTAG
jgi:hypothetical protein